MSTNGLGANAIVATTTMVVHTYFHPNHMHEVAKLDIPLAPAVLDEALPTPLVAPWDLPLLPLPNFEMEPMSPRLPSVEILP